MKIGWHLLRVKSWVKNGFLFLPAIFSLRLLQWDNVSSVLVGSIVFSLISSFVYIINDIKDAEEDTLHPQKKIDQSRQVRFLNEKHSLLV